MGKVKGIRIIGQFYGVGQYGQLLVIFKVIQGFGNFFSFKILVFFYSEQVGSSLFNFIRWCGVFRVIGVMYILDLLKRL